MVKYVKSAPQPLIDWYETDTIHKGRDFLERLITRPKMGRAWPELSKRSKKKDHAKKLFGKIVFIEQESRKSVVLRREEEQKKYCKIAKQAQKLAAAITEGPLNKLVFEYFSADTMNTNGIANWNDKSKMERNNLPYDLLMEWPPLIEILKSLETQAIKLGGEAMKQPRTVERQKDGYRQLYFVRALAEYVKAEYDSPLYGTVASISSAVLEVDLTKEAVARMAKGSA